MGFLGSLSGGALGFGEKLYDNYASAKAATKSFDRDKWMMSNRYQLQVQDMVKAGLNPMLAAGASPPAPSAPVARTDQGSAVRSVGVQASAAQAAAAADNLKADSEYKRALARTEANRPENVSASTGREVATADQARAETERVRAETAKISDEIREINARIAKYGAETATLERMRELDARIKILESEGQRLLLPEKGARGKAGEAVGRGMDVVTGTGLRDRSSMFIGDGLDALKNMRDNLWKHARKFEDDRKARRRRNPKSYPGG